MKKIVYIEALAVLLGAFILGVIFWSIDNADPMWAIVSFILIYDPDARLVISSAFSRLVHTIFGSLLGMAVIFTLGIHKWTLPVGLAVSALICGLCLRSRPAWRIVLVTVALIVGSSILQASLGPYIAVTRSVEVSAGSLLAVVFSWGMGRLASRPFFREPR